jgi:calcineurin-like phosphoesterase
MTTIEAVERLRKRIRERFKLAWPRSRVQGLLAAINDEDEAMLAIERANRVQRRLAREK